MKQIADISHNQESFDAVAYAKRHDRIRLKAAQGTGFVDPTYVERTAAAHQAGLSVDHYSYLTDEDGLLQADHFMNLIRPHLKAGDRLMADCEADGVTGALVERFVDRCHSIEPSYDGLEYVGPYFARANSIVSVHGWGLVLADYTSAKSPVFWPDGFEGVPWEWQFTNKASTAGIGGESDLSRVVRGDLSTDLTWNQARHTAAFTRSMNNRKHRMTPKALHQVDGALTAATHAKGIR